jgi:hypothetical protein
MTMTELDLSHLQHVTLIADASESGADYWEVTRGATLALFNALAGRRTVEIYLLGSSQPISAAALAQLRQHEPGGAWRPCSLVAPTLRAVLQRWRRTQAVILIGNGEIFDLADWVDHTAIERWAIVQSGPDRLQSQSKIAELPAQQSQRALALLARPAEQRRHQRQAPSVSVSNRSYRWRLDQAGYPMIWIEPLGAFVHLFPITKTQFERFLGTINTSAFGDSWYAQLLALNPRRVVSGESRAYEQLFITGVLPREAGQFGRWLGPGHRLLTVDQWRRSYEWLATQSSSSIGPAIEQEIALDARSIWEQIEAELRPRTLRDLALMDQGIIEWAADTSDGNVRAVGMGQTRPGFGPAALRRAIDPLRPIARAAPVRLKYIGFRMMTRAL